MRTRKELDDEVADLKGVVDGIERDYANAKAVAERDYEVRLR